MKIALFISLFISLSAHAADVTWPYYLGDAAATKFSYADQINRTNVGKLKIAWVWDSIDEGILLKKKLVTLYNESTPLMVDGRLYLSTALNQIVALDPGTGRELWTYDPQVYLDGYPSNLGFVQRAVAYWSVGGVKRIFVNTNNAYLIALDADTGKLVKTFGTDGKVDLTTGFRRLIDRHRYGMTSPPIACGNTIVVGSSVADEFSKYDAPPGDIRGFDAETGALKWTFHTIPQDTEFGVETWKNDSWKYMGNANAWPPMSVDPQLRAVFVPVGTPSSDFYGADRLGDGLFGESLVSLDCETGIRNWHFQLVHHGLWDYDPPAAPVLMDIGAGRNKIKAVAQVTKQGFVFAFNRETGAPLWPIVETAVPQTDVAGEVSSPTQPIPSKPLPFDRQGVFEKDLIDFTPELLEQAKEIVGRYKTGPLYTPPSIQGTINLPGLVGGASWAGAAYSPLTGKLYVPSVTNAHVTKLYESNTGEGPLYHRDLFSATLPGIDGLPVFKPPYGRVTAIDMSSGDHSWMAPIGRGPKDHPALAGLNIKEDLGWPRRTHVLATPTLLFAAQEGTTQIVGIENKGKTLLYNATDDEPYLRALDLETGAKIAEIPLPGNGWGAPMTYIVNGKQYIVIPFGGAGLRAGLMALSLQ